MVKIDPPDVTPAEEEYPHTEAYTNSTEQNPQEVTLSATPAQNWGFEKWTGDLTTELSPDSVFMSESKSVTAVFEQALLTMSVTGDGTIDTTPAGDVISTTVKGFRPGVTVDVEALPEDNWGFWEWRGAIQTSDNPAEVIMNGDQSVEAVFFQTTLSVTVDGQGKVKTTPFGDPAQTPPFTRNFAPGEQVILEAVETEPGWVFTGWSGDATGSVSPVNVDHADRPDYVADEVRRGHLRADPAHRGQGGAGHGRASRRRHRPPPHHHLHQRTDGEPCRQPGGRLGLQ